MKASFNRLAEQELIAAAQHIQAKANLGREFLGEYEAWEARTRRFPAACPEIAPGIRCGFLKRFIVRFDVGDQLFVRNIEGVDLDQS